MLADYQLLAREQHLRRRCVGVATATSRSSWPTGVCVCSDTAGATASSPFWSTARHQILQRANLGVAALADEMAAPVSSAAEYDKLVAELVASGAIADAGMVYFDVRPAVAAPAGTAGV
jgi:carboxylate-amine ligase